MFDGPDGVLELVVGCTGGTVDRVFDEPDGEVKIVLDGPCGVG